MLDATTQCENCNDCPIRERCERICDTIEETLPSMERGRVDFEDLARIHEGRIVTNLVLDNEDILTERQSEIVRMYYRENMLQGQIGASLGITQQAVADSLKSVRHRFMRMYKKRRAEIGTSTRKGQVAEEGKM